MQLLGRVDQGKADMSDDESHDRVERQGQTESPDETMETFAGAVSADAWSDFVRAFRNRNATLIVAGDPSASEATRAMKREALRADQHPHAERVSLFSRLLDDIAINETGAGAEFVIPKGSIENLRTGFLAAQHAADMPQGGGGGPALGRALGEGALVVDQVEPRDQEAPAGFAHEAVSADDGLPPVRGARRYHQIMLGARDHLLPVERGYPCARGWSYRPPKALLRPYLQAAGMPTPRSGRAPMGVTWHRVGGTGLDSVRRRFAGDTPGESRTSTHYCIGVDLKDGIERYVAIEDRAWHAGQKQTLRWDGRPCALRTRRGLRWVDERWKAARTTIGVSIVGFAEPITHREGGDIWDGVAAEDIVYAALPNGQGRRALRFSDAQYEMMIAVGREIVQRWPHLRPWHHHGHFDICPDYRWDPLGLDFARVLRGVYAGEDVPDVWTPLRHVAQRQRVLKRLCAVLKLRRDLVVDGIWGQASRSTLRLVQRAIAESKAKRRPGAFSRWKDALFMPDAEEVDARAKPAYTAVNGYWTTFTNWDVFAVLGEHGFDLAESAGAAAADPLDAAADETDRQRRR